MPPFDSDDDEHKLVIDLDAGLEGPSQSSALPAKRKGRKKMRSSKIQRVDDDDDVNEESSDVEILHTIDNVNSSTSSTAKKRRKRRGRHLWTKVKKVKNGESSKQQKIEEEANGENDKENASKKRVLSACRMEFFDRYSFTFHMHKHGTNKRRHQCTVCSRSLSTAGSLTRHLRIHSGEKPYACSFCGKRFSVKNNMTRHQKKHMKLKISRYTADRLLANSQNDMSVPGPSNQRDGSSRFPVPKVSENLEVSKNELEDVRSVNSPSLKAVIQNLRAESAFIPTAATTGRIFMNGGKMTLGNHFSLTKFGPLQDEPLNLSFDQPLDLSLN